MRRDFDLDDLIRVLAECPEYEPCHPLGRPFMSAYQIAIRFAEAHPGHRLVRNLEVGGEGTGERRSLAQRIAHFPSGVAQDPESVVEDAFISHRDIKDFFLDNKGHAVRVSALNGPAHSIFRLPSPS